VGQRPTDALFLLHPAKPASGFLRTAYDKRTAGVSLARGFAALLSVDSPWSSALRSDRGDSPWTAKSTPPTACPHYSTACPPPVVRTWTRVQAPPAASSLVEIVDKRWGKASRAWMPGLGRRRRRRGEGRMPKGRCAVFLYSVSKTADRQKQRQKQNKKGRKKKRYKSMP